MRRNMRTGNTEKRKDTNSNGEGGGERTTAEAEGTRK
jgi:hypothetical protein